MKKAVWSGILAVAAVFVMSTPAMAQSTANASINVSVTVSARAKLSLGTAAINWTDQDPDSVLTLSSGAFNVDVKARTSQGATVNLTVLADGNLTASGGASIAISNLTWVGTGDVSGTGTSNATVAQTVMSFTNSGSKAGTQNYSMPNSWAYATGNYTAALNYTLTAP
jgi:hypothetical protein